MKRTVIAGIVTEICLLVVVQAGTVTEDLREGIFDATVYSATGPNWTTVDEIYIRDTDGWHEPVVSPGGSWARGGATVGGVSRDDISAIVNYNDPIAATVAEYTFYSPKTVETYYGHQDGATNDGGGVVRYVIQVEDDGDFSTLLDTTVSDTAQWRHFQADLSAWEGFVKLRFITDPAGEAWHDWSHWAGTVVTRDDVHEIEIQSLSSNGEIAWTAPSGSISHVEWASRLTPVANWSRSWSQLKYISSTGGGATADVPMFYRIMCVTNGLLLPTPVGRQFTAVSSDAYGGAWTQEFSFAGLLSGAGVDEYVLVKMTNIVPNPPPAGFEDDPYSEFFARSTETDVYLADLPLDATESLEWQMGPIGHSWTNPPDEDGDIVAVTITATESVTVPAGTFPGCVRFEARCINQPSAPDPVWIDWIKPGFMKIKGEDYWLDDTNAAPAVWQLQSWTD